MFSVFYSFVAAYGFKHYGKLTGVGVVVIALFGFIQIPLVEVSLELEDFSYVNMGFIGACLLALLFPYYVEKNYLEFRPNSVVKRSG